MLVRSPTVISWASYPMNENTRTSDEVTSRLYLPSVSVAVPRAVPFTTTKTPGSGVPSDASVTLPVTVRCWACKLNSMHAQHKVSKNLFIISEMDLGLLLSYTKLHI